MKIRAYIFCLFSMVTLMHSAVYGQDTLNSLQQLLDTKVISGSKSAQNIEKAPLNIIVISKEQIEERGYRTLHEVMIDLPGFDFAMMEPTGEYPAHFKFRGMGDVGQEKYVVMLDGVPQNDISNGWVRNTGFNFTLIDVERIEIVSGPGSSLYGLNAYAGFINVITQNGMVPDNATFSATASMQYGSGNTIFPELNLNFRTRSGLAFQLSGRYYLSDGDNGIGRYDPGNYFHNNYEPDSVNTQEYGMIANEPNKKINDGFKTGINDYYVRGRLQDGGFSLGFNFWSKQEDLGSEVVGYEYFANTDGIDYQIHHQGKSLNMDYRYNIGDRVHSLSRVYFINTSVLPETGFTYTYQYQSVDNGVDPPVLDKKKTYQSEGFLIGMEQLFEYQIGKKNQIITSFQFEQKVRQYFNIYLENDIINEQSPTISGLTIQPVYFSKNGAVLLQDEQKLFENLYLTAGLRYDIDQYFGNQLNPRLALIRNVKEGFGFKLIGSRGFRAPTIFELYDEWRGNENLKPEHTWTSDLQLFYTIKSLGLFKVDFFANYQSDEILLLENLDTDVVPIGSKGEHTNYYQNSGKSQTYGLNAYSIVQLHPTVRIFFNYGYLCNGDFEQIDNTAAHKINFGVNYKLEKYANINLRCNWIGKTKAPSTNLYYFPKTAESIADVGYDYVTEDNPDGYIDPIFLLNLNIRSADIIRSDEFSLKAHLLVKNLLNTKYAMMGRQSGDGVRPVDSIQSTIFNPNGFIPAYHPGTGIQWYFGITLGFN